MKQKSLNFSIAICLIVLSLITMSYFVITQPKPEIQNVHLIFRNSSIDLLNKSFAVTAKIDGRTVYNTSKMSEIKDYTINLTEGKHTIVVYDKVKTTNSSNDFIVRKNKDTYIYIYYRHYPEYEKYLPIYRKNYLKRLVERNKNLDLTAAEKRIDSVIDINYLKTEVLYVPEERNFKIVVKDHRDIIL